MIERHSGIADDLSLVLNLALPAGCSVNYLSADTFHIWKIDHDGQSQISCVSKEFPPLPPGSTNKLFTFVRWLSESEAASASALAGSAFPSVSSITRIPQGALR